jgi:hypothetical protein
LNLTRSLRPGHVYIGARRGRPGRTISSLGHGQREQRDGVVDEAETDEADEDEYRAPTWRARCRGCLREHRGQHPLYCLVSARVRRPCPFHRVNTRTHGDLPWFRLREGISRKTLRPACLSSLNKMSPVGVQGGLRGKARRHPSSDENSLLLCYSISENSLLLCYSISQELRD